MSDRDPADAEDVGSGDGAFTRCQNCGGILVRLETHRCPSSGPGTTRAERERQADRDQRDADELVGVFRRANGNTYAYHELDDSDQPRCPTRNPSKARRFDVMPRHRAQALGKSPCGHCRSDAANRADPER